MGPYHAGTASQRPNAKKVYKLRLLDLTEGKFFP